MFHFWLKYILYPQITAFLNLPSLFFFKISLTPLMFGFMLKTLPFQLNDLNQTVHKANAPHLILYFSSSFDCPETCVFV